MKNKKKHVLILGGSSDIGIEVIKNFIALDWKITAHFSKNKHKLKILKKYIKNSDKIKFNDNMKVAIITPDIDIIPDANILHPAYLVFENYEIILKWNRSLRFGLAVCNLKDKFKNEI